MVTNFDIKENFWLRQEEVEKVEKIIKEHTYLYTSKSHFYRAAIIRLIKEHEAKQYETVSGEKKVQ